MTLRVEIKKLIMLEAVLNTQALFREKRNMKKGWLDITMLHNQFSHMWSIIAMHGLWENNFLDRPLSQQAKLTFFHLHFVLFTL